MTTDSNHALPIFPNLARDFTPTGPDQLWVADVTYIRLRAAIVFLAVLLSGGGSGDPYIDSYARGYRHGFEGISPEGPSSLSSSSSSSRSLHIASIVY